MPRTMVPAMAPLWCRPVMQEWWSGGGCGREIAGRGSAHERLAVGRPQVNRKLESSTLAAEAVRCLRRMAVLCSADGEVDNW
ncbi:GTP--RNA guanylyltransferase [Psidium guajava]|nr:GTP--RNA guanylyltransferase [Psidium guajava]